MIISSLPQVTAAFFFCPVGRGVLGRELDTEIKFEVSNWNLKTIT
jgi:hypothetical protein